jgi:hypothetical protein
MALARLERTPFPSCGLTEACRMHPLSIAPSPTPMLWDQVHPVHIGISWLEHVIRSPNDNASKEEDPPTKGVPIVYEWCEVLMQPPAGR